jgi:hypothetical protein
VSKRFSAICRIWVRTIGCLILVLILGYTSVVAEENQRSVFVRVQCDGKLASKVHSSFVEAMQTSQKYHLVQSLENEGRLGSVFAIYMVCTERSEFAAVATTYGLGECAPNGKCAVKIDGSSLKLALCDSYAAADCGRALFKRFDEYISNTNRP